VEALEPDDEDEDAVVILCGVHLLEIAGNSNGSSFP
jgi:hypothetical protein